MDDAYVIDFADLSMADWAKVGDKNASLGELYRNLRPLGIGVVDGFAITVSAYHRLLNTEGLADILSEVLDDLDPSRKESLASVGQYARTAVKSTDLPNPLVEAIVDAYDRLSERLRGEVPLAVRSSGLPGTSIAGQHETILNVRGKPALLMAVHWCFASLFTDRAIDSRAQNGSDPMGATLSVGVQPMVRSDIGAAGMIFTHENSLEIIGSYGLFRGMIDADEWTVRGNVIFDRCLGAKEKRRVPSNGGTAEQAVPMQERKRFCLADDEVLRLANWARQIESHFGYCWPMDIEWAKDGISGELYIVQIQEARRRK